MHKFFAGFAQKRRSNGSFVFTDPTGCSPIDHSGATCSFTAVSGFYETSSWEYSWYVIFSQYLKTMNDNNAFRRFAPHDIAHLMQLMGGNVMSFSSKSSFT